MYIVYYAIHSTLLDIISYSMPVGQTIKNSKVIFSDTSYNGVITSGVYKDGTGILTDGKFGPDDAKQDKGKGWVGWSSNFTNSYIDITFEFSGVRKFKDVTLTVNVNKTCNHAVFNRSEIFFASTSDGFSDTSFLQDCPKESENSGTPYSRNITLSLCENTARFIRLRLYFGGKWLLLTEISFNSGILLLHYFNSVSMYLSIYFQSNSIFFCLLLTHYVLALHPALPCFVSTQSASVCQGEVFVQIQKT